jgi:hypothetical protein
MTRSMMEAILNEHFWRKIMSLIGFDSDLFRKNKWNESQMKLILLIHWTTISRKLTRSHKSRVAITTNKEKNIRSPPRNSKNNKEQIDFSRET